MTGAHPVTVAPLVLPRNTLDFKMQGIQKEPMAPFLPNLQTEYNMSIWNQGIMKQK